ncbi:hypothetical protein ACH47Z_41750 [Streptomyces sp. NPDC020192]
MHLWTELSAGAGANPATANYSGCLLGTLAGDRPDTSRAALSP